MLLALELTLLWLMLEISGSLQGIMLARVMFDPHSLNAFYPIGYIPSEEIEMILTKVTALVESMVMMVFFSQCM